jgi:hypothetical protein
MEGPAARTRREEFADVSNEPNPNAPGAASTTASAIENEIPAYRAISPQAVLALILGVLSVLSFASWYFLVFAAAAVLVGFLADRKIQRLSDVLTGRGLAQAGVGLGLIFGLTSLTISTVQGVVRASQATTFAKAYADVLSKGSFDDNVWYSQHPVGRKEITPEKLVKDLTQPGPGLDHFESKYAPLRQLKKAVTEDGADIHFERIEKHGQEDLTPVATALYEVHTPQAKNPADKERFALAVMKGATTRGRLEWWVDQLMFPYKPESYVAPEKPVDDGHGHAPGQH